MKCSQQRSKVFYFLSPGWVIFDRSAGFHGIFSRQSAEVIHPDTSLGCIKAHRALSIIHHVWTLLKYKSVFLGKASYRPIMANCKNILIIWSHQPKHKRAKTNHQHFLEKYFIKFEDKETVQQQSCDGRDV